MIVQADTLPEIRRRRFNARKKLRILRRDGWRCVYCNRNLLESFDTLLVSGVDHLYPASGGGTNGDDNLVAACACCNQLKADMRVGSIQEGRRVIAERRREHAAAWGAELRKHNVTVGEQTDVSRSLSPAEAEAIFSEHARRIAESLHLLEARLDARRRPARRGLWRQLLDRIRSWTV